MQENNPQTHNYAERVEFIRSHMGISAKEFASRLGISQTSYHNYKNGRIPPSDLLTDVILKTNVNAEWLMCGRGRAWGDGGVKMATHQAALVPVLGEVQAGPNGRFLTDIPVYYLPLPHGLDVKNLFACEVQGDSMHPAYKCSDVVFARQNGEPNSGDDCLVQLDWGETVIKRWHRIDKDTVQLISINPDYSPLEAKMQQIKAVAKIVDSQWGASVRNCRVDLDDVSQPEDADDTGPTRYTIDINADMMHDQGLKK